MEEAPDSAQIPSLMPHMESYLCQCCGHHYHSHTRKRLSIRMWIYKGRTTCATSTARFFFPTVLSSLKVLSVTLMTSSSGCCSLVTKSCLLFCDPHGLQPTRLLCPWDFSGKNTGGGSHFLFQRIFLTLGQTQVFCIAGRFFTTASPGKFYLLGIQLALSNSVYPSITGSLEVGSCWHCLKSSVSSGLQVTILTILLTFP